MNRPAPRMLLASLLGALLAVACTMPAIAYADSYDTVTPGALTVASDLAFPPLEYIPDGSTDPVGFEVDLVNEIGRRCGLTVKWLPAQKFDTIVPMIKQGGKADIGASAFTITDERKKEIDFSEAYIDSNQGVVTRVDAAATTTEALNSSDKKIAVQSGTTGESWVRENLPAAQVVALDDAIQACTGCSTGLYDAVVADLPVLMYLSSSYPDLTVVKQIPTGERYGLVLSKANPDLTKAVSGAIQSMQEDGTISALEVQWFGELLATAGTSSEVGQQLTVSSCTARPNEDGTSNVIGGEATRLTFEAYAGSSEQIKSVTLSIPGDGTFQGASVGVTVLDGLKRMSVESDTQINGNQLTVTFAQPIAGGSLMRLEIEGAALPSGGGDVTLSGSYVTADGQTNQLSGVPSIATVALSPVQAIVKWLDGQAWVAAWNSNQFLGMFFKPQLLVTSMVSLFSGWVLCLLLVIIAYPFAVVLGLAFSFLKMSRIRVLRAIALVYINVIRGTPLFLQIYIAFFGLPMMGINISNNILGIVVMALNSSAYLAEIFRAGIQSIPRGQNEAASSLGMNGFQTMIYVILPQTVRRVIPTVTSDFITAYKDTSLLSSVGVMELMMFSKNLTATSGNMTPYMAAAIYYLIVTLPLIKGVTLIERRLERAQSGSGPRPKTGETVHTATEEMRADAAIAGTIIPTPAKERKGANGPSAIEALTAPFRPNLPLGGAADAD